MKKTVWLKKLGCVAMAAVMLAGCLCGCGGRPGTGEPAAAATGSVEVQDVPVAQGEVPVQSNAVISEHARHNRDLFSADAAPKEADHFDFYITNTEAMQGFANGSSITTYQQVPEGPDLGGPGDGLCVPAADPGP